MTLGLAGTATTLVVGVFSVREAAESSGSRVVGDRVAGSRGDSTPVESTRSAHTQSPSAMDRPSVETRSTPPSKTEGEAALRTRSTRSRTSSAPIEPPIADADDADDLEAQNRLLRRASDALSTGDAERTLALTERYARRFPDGVLDDVRIALRIESLCLLDKRAQARGEARLFLRRDPTSPVAERIRIGCP